jgi:hypothetical protein
MTFYKSMPALQLLRKYRIDLFGLTFSDRDAGSVQIGFKPESGAMSVLVLAVMPLDENRVIDFFGPYPEIEQFLKVLGFVNIVGVSIHLYLSCTFSLIAACCWLIVNPAQ